MNSRVLGVGVACAVVAVGVLVILLRPGRSAGPPADSASTSAPLVERLPDTPSAVEAPPRRAGRSGAPAPVTPVDAGAAPVAAAPDTATLRIVADVPGAQVFLDRQFIGNAPVTAEGVKPGTHQLNVSAEGFDGFAQTIDVEPGPRDLTVRFRDVRLDARLAVVHKHRMGRCTGELVATPLGLRYDSADADDQFTVSLADLEAFQVDYQDKNLRVKVRRGKQYNFTDPDGIADRLFVFHRDVERARQRIARGEAPG